jgi:hypothetical protein
VWSCWTSITIDQTTIRRTGLADATSQTPVIVWGSDSFDHKELQDRVVHRKWTDVTKEHVASIFMVDYTKQETGMKHVALLPASVWFLLRCSSETSVDFQRAALYPIRQNSSLTSVRYLVCPHGSANIHMLTFPEYSQHWTQTTFTLEYCRGSAPGCHVFSSAEHVHYRERESRMGMTMRNSSNECARAHH